MAVSSTTNTVFLVGNNSSVVFSYPYYFFSQSDLQVYLYDTLAGGIVSQTLNNQYSIAGTANAQGLYPNGANVVFQSAIVNTTYVVIDRQPVQEQTFAILQTGLISSTGLTQQLDYLTLLTQALEDQNSRAVALPEGFGLTNFNPLLPQGMGLIGNAGGMLAINSGATGFVLINPATGFGYGTQGYVLTGQGSSAFAVFAPLPPVNIGSGALTGVLLPANGGTGNSVTPPSWSVAIGSGSLLAYTAPGSQGQFLIAQASSAPVFQTVQTSLSNGSGVVPVTNGGTGNTLTPPSWSVAIGSGSLYAYTLPGASGQVLTANASSAPTFQTLSAPNLVGTIDTAAASSNGVVIGSGAIYMQSVSGTNPGLVNLSNQTFGQGVKTFNSSVLVPNGTLANPSYSFSADGASGMYRVGPGEIAISCSGIQAFDILAIAGGNVNIGLGGAGTAQTSTAQPFYAQRSFNGTVTWALGNNGTGNLSVSVLEVFNGTGSNYVTLENWANNSNNSYLGGGSALFSSPNQTQFIIGSENTGAGGYLGVTVGGRTLVNERLRLTPQTFAIENGANLTMAGSSTQTGTLIFNVANGSGTVGYAWNYPNSPGTSGQVLTQGSGLMTWSSPLTNPMNTLGDSIVGGASGAATRLGGNTTSAIEFLSSTGSGGVATTQSWKVLPTSSYYQGYFASGTNQTWDRTNTSLGDPVFSNSALFLISRVGNISVAVASGLLAGVTFTPPNINSVYLVTVATKALCTSAGGVGSIAIVSGANVIATSVFTEGAVTTAEDTWNTMTGIFAPSSVAPVTLKLQTAASTGLIEIGSAGGASNTSAVEWTLLQII